MVAMEIGNRLFFSNHSDGCKLKGLNYDLKI